MGKITEKKGKSLFQRCLQKILYWRKLVVFGVTDWVDIGFISALLVFNVIDQIIKGQAITERALYTVPLLFAVFLIHILPFKKYIKSFIFLCLAILVHYDSPNPSDFSAAIFFLFAFSELKHIRIAVIASIASLAVIVYKSSIVGDSNPQALSMAVLFTYLYVRSYFSFFKETGFSKKSPLSQEQTDLMRMVSEQGLTQKEIAVKLSISQDKVFSKIKEIRELLTPEGDSTITKEQAIYIIVSKYGISDGKIL